MIKKANKGSKLTIDFVGLFAFVQVEDAIVVLGMAPHRFLSLGLCKHDPVVIFQYPALRTADEARSHWSFSTFFQDTKNPNGKHQALGVWPLEGKELSIQDAPNTCPNIDSTEIFELDIKGPVDLAKWLSSTLPQGLGCRWILQGGRLSVPTLTDEDWYLYPKDDASGPKVSPFAQVVRWELVREEENTTAIITARTNSSGRSERLAIKPDGQIAASNLCPFDSAAANKSFDPDISAYYELTRRPLPAKQRSVLHKRPTGGGMPTRPNLSACPPVLFRIASKN